MLIHLLLNKMPSVRSWVTSLSKPTDVFLTWESPGPLAQRQWHWSSLVQAPVLWAWASHLSSGFQFDKALWHVVGAVITHQIRVDFWERPVVSGGREGRCWMQEAAFKVWSLEQGNLMPEPRPPSLPTSALPAFLLEPSHTLSPSPRPCHPGSSAHLEIQTLGVPEGLLAFSFCMSQGSSVWASRACLLGTFWGGSLLLSCHLCPHPPVTESTFPHLGQQHATLVPREIGVCDAHMDLMKCLVMSVSPASQY